MRHLANFFLIHPLVAMNCYICFTEDHNSSCAKNARSASWTDCNGQCQVWSLNSEVDGRLYMLERSCSGICRTGCTQLADMEHRFVGCSTCCDSNFCNVGSPSSSILITSSIILLLMSYYIIQCIV